jgi:ribosome-dependent ATPase
MSQSFSLYGQKTVRENLLLHARLFRLGADAGEKRVRELLKQFDLEAQADARAGDLPLGLRQRLSLAVAVVHSPEILILDEPTSGVDPMARDAFWQILGTLSREDGVTIFVSTHFMNEATLCDRIALMHAGHVLAEGHPDEIAAKHGSGDLDAAFIALIDEVDPRPEARENESLSETDTQDDASARDGIGKAFARAFAYAGREATEILRDPIRLVFAFVGTVILMFLFAYGISMDVEDMRYAVLDQDQSPESRAYLQTYESSPYFLETEPVASHEALLRRLRAGETTLILNIPPDFGRAQRQGRDAQVSAWIDGANTQRAATIQGYVVGGHSSYIAQTMRDARIGAGGGQELRIDTLFRYNPTNDSIFAIAPAVPAMLLLMFPAILMAISVARFAVLTLGALAYVMASTSYGLLISTFSKTQVTAVFATMVIAMMPTVIFSGMIQPVETLEGGARLIGSFWPTRYYMEMSVGAFTKGLSAAQLLENIPLIALFIPIFAGPALVLLKKQEA